MEVENEIPEFPPPNNSNLEMFQENQEAQNGYEMPQEFGRDEDDDGLGVPLPSTRETMSDLPPPIQINSTNPPIRSAPPIESDDTRKEYLGLSENLKNLQTNLNFTQEILQLKEIKDLKQVIDKSQSFKHTFELKFAKLDFSKLKSELEGEDLEYFNMYLKMSDKAVRKAAALIERTVQKASHGTFLFKHTYNWFVKLKEKLKDRYFGESQRKETFVSLTERIQKIFSAYGEDLQTQSDDDLDYVNSECYKRLLEYCKTVENSQNSNNHNQTNTQIPVYPLVFLMWRDDWQEFGFSQVETTSKGGLSFRILNFPYEFQKKLNSVFLYSVSEPKNQLLMTDIIVQFNFLFRGLEFEGKRYIPFFSVALCDNPERYKFLKRNWWNSGSLPCSHCGVSVSLLPFEKLPLNRDEIYLKNLNSFLPIYATYEKEKQKILSDDRVSLNLFQIRDYVLQHQRFETTIEEYRKKCGHRFVKSDPLPLQPLSFFKKLLRQNVLPHFPLYTYSLDISPFIYLNSYWKGLFPLFLSVPMEPFHTLFNVMKTTLLYFSENDLFMEGEFENFVKSVNSSKEERIKFSQDFKLWHGDQYLVLLEKTDLLNAFALCVKPYERDNFVKLSIILSIVKHFSPKEVRELEIPAKLRKLHFFEMSDDYTYFVKKRITSHQIIHLIDMSWYLGYLGNYDGQSHEKMHKRLGRKATRLFLGGDISRQMCNFEVLKENIVLINAQKQTDPAAQVVSSSNSSTSSDQSEISPSNQVSAENSSLPPQNSVVENVNNGSKYEKAKWIELLNSFWPNDEN